MMSGKSRVTITSRGSLIELVHEEGVEEVALGEAPLLTHLHIPLLLQACSFLSTTQLSPVTDAWLASIQLLMQTVVPIMKPSAAEPMPGGNQCHASCCRPALRLFRRI